MRPLTDREKRTVRFAGIGVAIYLALFCGLQVWKFLEKRRSDYRQLAAEAQQLRQNIQQYQDKVQVVKKLMDDFHLDPAKLKKETVVSDASAAIQKAAKSGGLQLGPIRESPAHGAGMTLATVQLESSGQVPAVLAFLAAFVWRKRTDNLANNPRLRRQRAVAQLLASGMDDLKKYAAANQPDEFFATLFRLLQEQIGERLDCPASAITENVIDEHAVLRGAPQTTLDGLRELFQLCNQARYAPVRGTSELNSVAAQFRKTIAGLQEVKA